jgi:hypothetical protein
MSDTQTDSIIDIDPTPPPRIVLPGGKYGTNGEATLESMRMGEVKFGNDKGKTAIQTRVSVLTPQYGHVSFFTDWALDGPRKAYTLKMLANLGLDLDAMRGEDGRVRFDASGLCPVKVIAEINFREYPMKDSEGNPTGEMGQANDVRMIWKRA